MWRDCWSTGKGRLIQVKIQGWMRILEWQGERGTGGVWRGKVLLAFSQWVTTVSNLLYALHLSYTSVMGWVFEGVHGSLVPSSRQALKQRGCSTVTKWPWKISSNVWRKNNTLRLQLQWMCNACWHQAGTRDENWLRKEITSYCMTSLLSGATRCFSRDSHPPGWRWLEERTGKITGQII